MNGRHLHFQPLAYTVRIFEAGKTYENGDPYAGVFTVQMLGKDAAHVSGLHGVMDRDVWHQIRNRLGMKGVKTITYDTNGGRRTVATTGDL